MNKTITTIELTWLNNMRFAIEALFFYVCSVFVMFYIAQSRVVFIARRVKFHFGQYAKMKLHLWAQKKGDVGKLCTTENAPWETTILSTNLLREKEKASIQSLTITPQDRIIKQYLSPSNSLSELRAKLN